MVRRRRENLGSPYHKETKQLQTEEEIGGRGAEEQEGISLAITTQHILNLLLVGPVLKLQQKVTG